MNSMFNQLLNVKGTVVEGVRIADSHCVPNPCSRSACVRAGACSDAPDAVDSTYAYHSREPNPRKQQKPQK